MRSVITVGAFALFLGLGAGLARSQDRAETDRRTETDKRTVLSDEQFVKEIGQANCAEILLGRIARHRADSDAVKDFGRHMIQDHTKAQDDLAECARKKGFTVPDQPSSEQQATADRLDRLSGAEFDREFVQVMVKDHSKVVSLVESYANDGKDADLKAFANKALPVLKHHLSMAQDLEKRIR